MSSILAKMAVQISANTAEFNKALSKTNKDISSFTGGIKSMAATLGVAFGVQQIASFGLEVAKLAGQAEAVEIAFRRLPNATKLMVDLKEATGNTVSELDLMKRTVQAANFDISLKALPRLLEFATLRAQQTGQSVDYLVDSIVTGIGRKSKLILDNLGISATQLSAEFKGASLEAQNVGAVTEAVGRIAERNLKNMAGFSQNTATSIQQLSAAWDDLKVSIGEIVNKSGIGTFIRDMGAALRLINGELSKDQVRKLEVSLGFLIKRSKELGNQDDVVKYTKMLAELTSKYGLLRDEAIEPVIEKLEEQKKETVKVTDAQRDLNSELERMGRIAKLERELAGPKKPFSVVGQLFDSESIDTQIQDAIGKLKTLPEQFRPIADEMINISGLVSGGIADIANAFGEAATGNVNFGDAIIRSLASFAQQFGALLIATGIAEISFKKFSGPAMIAAGAALVALGGAVKGAISKRPNLGGGGGSSGRGGGFSSPNNFTMATSATQNSLSFESIIRGQDLYVVLSNYEKNNKSTRS
jgi:hypothetical protein